MANTPRKNSPWIATAGAHGWTIRLAGTMLVWAFLATAAYAGFEGSSGPPALIVKLHSSGPDALAECAQSRWDRRQSNRSLAQETPHPIDEFHARFRTLSIKALFRRRGGDEPFAAQVRALERRGSRLSSRERHRQAVKSGQVPENAQNLKDRLSDLAHVYRIELPGDVSPTLAMEALQKSPGVEYVQFDHPQTLDRVFDDPFLSTAGAWGQPYSDLWGLERIDAPAGWDISLGEESVIAIVDTGLDTAHPDIADNIWVNPGEDLDGNGQVDPEDWNGLDDDGNGFVDDLVGWNFVGFGDLEDDGDPFLGSPDIFDDVGHGSHVSGIAAAVGNNGIGIAGVAPRAKVMSLKGFPTSGSARDSDIWRAVLYAIETGADVVNGSWSCDVHCPENPLATEVLAIAEEAGVVFVTSAGNSSIDVVVNNPENSTSAITVGSLNFDDQLSSFSNRGWLVDLLAPGGGPSVVPGVPVARRNILSLFSSGTNPVELPFAVGSDYFRLSGTSMAAPFVTGAVAALLAHRPELSPADVRRLLRLSSRDLGAPGHDPVYGAGVLDLSALLTTELPDLDLVLSSPAPNRILDPQAGPIPIFGTASGHDLHSYEVAFAVGIQGGPFTPIARVDASTRDSTLLAEWDASTLPDGAYTLRLRATLQQGGSVDEFTLVSIERNRFLRMSEGANREGEPSLDGNSVVWRALRSAGEEIRLGGFDRWGRTRTPQILHESDKAIERPTLSLGDVAWLERDTATSQSRVLTCRLQGFHRRRNGSGEESTCDAIVQAEAPNRLNPFRMAKRQLLWTPRVDGLLDLLTCRLRGRRSCDAQRLPSNDPSTHSVRLLDFDGRTAVWSTGPQLSRLELCSVAPGKAGCNPVLVPLPPLMSSVDAAAIDGSRLVIETFGFGGPKLFHCEVDLATGACDLRTVGDGEMGSQPSVSGRRITWTRGSTTGASTIAYCEVDPVDGECRLQRVTGGIVASHQPDIDGSRIVWEDERFGPGQVLSAELPVLWAPALLELRHGARRLIHVYGRDPSGGPLSLRLEGVEGIRPEDVEARFEGGYGNLVRMVLNPNRVAEGRGVWRLVGEARGGWTTAQTIEVEIVKRRRHKVPWPWPRESNDRKARDSVRTF